MAGKITIDKDISKTRKNRKIEIKPVLRSWLEHYSGVSFNTRNWRYKYTLVRKSVLPSEKMKPDIFRHTWISMMIETEDRWPKIELQAGNTKEIQMQHYAELIESEFEVNEFWNLTPEKIGVFDVSEEEYANRAYENRRRAILQNRKKVGLVKSDI